MKTLKDTGAGCSITVYLNEKVYATKIKNLSENEMVAPEELPSIPAEYWSIQTIGGVKTLVADSASYDADSPIRREEELKPQAFKYRDIRMGGDEVGMLNGYSEAEILLAPLALANRNWLDALFKIYTDRLLDPSDETPFSNVGEKANSFTELLAEKRSQ